ncbi:transglycosylase SLT domain-containing protein [Zwartia sp.]|uniref:transglycosylase SLT domain-containing protein n=2 Tax=Zwartia sp. TaxID=2978004 RepID=UPI003BAF62F4
MNRFMSLRIACANTNKAFLSAVFCFFIILSGCAYIGQSAADDLDAQQLTASQVQPVSIWVAMQGSFALAPLDTPLVARQIKHYSASGTHLQQSLTLARPYLFYVLEEVKKRNMPAELALLPFLESSFNVRRGKGLNPAGLWGLMPVAARHLNLANTPFKDDRRDIVRSTEAALDLMQELYAKYGDWHIALAAYNWGPGNVSKAIDNNKRRKLPIHYLSLNIPAETLVFVPKLLALRQIIENPSQFNVALPEIPNAPYFAQIEVKHAIDIGVVLKLADISSDEFIDLNPSFNKTLIPAGQNQMLLLPVTKIERFEKQYRQYDQPLSQWRSIIVDQSQTLDVLAKKWGVDANRTRQMNHLRMGTSLQAGAMIMIPKPSLKDD